jgi:hypothetical protein
MAFTNLKLLHNFRRDNDDEAEPYLWSDDDFYDYLDEAQDEFCELVDVIAEDITVPYVAATVAAAGGYIDISSYRITRVRNADLLSPRKYLRLANQEEFDANPQMFVDTDYGYDARNSDWKDETGEPRVLLTDYESLSWRLYPIPTDDGTINARVFRKAASPPDSGTPLEVTDNQHQRAIMLKVRSLAYERQDSETYDSNQAQALESKFLARCSDFKKRVKRARRRTNTTSYGGIPQS